MIEFLTRKNYSNSPPEDVCQLAGEVAVLILVLIIRIRVIRVPFHRLSAGEIIPA